MDTTELLPPQSGYVSSSDDISSGSDNEEISDSKMTQSISLTPNESWNPREDEEEEEVITSTSIITNKVQQKLLDQLWDHEEQLDIEKLHEQIMVFINQYNRVKPEFAKLGAMYQLEDEMEREGAKHMHETWQVVSSITYDFLHLIDQIEYLGQSMVLLPRKVLNQVQEQQKTDLCHRIKPWLSHLGMGLLGGILTTCVFAGATELDCAAYFIS